MCQRSVKTRKQYRLVKSLRDPIVHMTCTLPIIFYIHVPWYLLFLYNNNISRTPRDACTLYSSAVYISILHISLDHIPVYSVPSFSLRLVRVSPPPPLLLLFSLSSPSKYLLVSSFSSTSVVFTSENDSDSLFLFTSSVDMRISFGTQAGGNVAGNVASRSAEGSTLLSCWQELVSY